MHLILAPVEGCEKSEQTEEHATGREFVWVVASRYRCVVLSADVCQWPNEMHTWQLLGGDTGPVQVRFGRAEGCNVFEQVRP